MPQNIVYTGLISNRSAMVTLRIWKSEYHTGLKLENYYFFTFTFLDLKLENYYFFTFLLFLDLKLENYSVFTFLLFLDLKLENYSVFTFLLFHDLKLENYSVFTFLLFLDLKLENYSALFHFFSTWSWKTIPYFDGVVQDCSNSSELLTHWSYCSIALRHRNME